MVLVQTILTDQGGMMEHQMRYRLGRYILTEYSNVLLMWATNTAFGGQRTGRCFIIGNILVFMPWERKEVGYLRLEFHINQTKLPSWNKTRYYCFSSDIRQVGMPQSLAKDELEQLSRINNPRPVNLEGSCSYRLGRYKIIADRSRATITWQTIRELGRVIGGKCMIESGILFLCPKDEEFDEGQSRLFYSELKILPEWNTTCAWGHQESLLKCEVPELNGSTLDNWSINRMKAHIVNQISFLSRAKTQ